MDSHERTASVARLGAIDAEIERLRLQEIGERWIEIDVLPDERQRLRDEWNALETLLTDDEPD